MIWHPDSLWHAKFRKSFPNVQISEQSEPCLPSWSEPPSHCKPDLQALACPSIETSSFVVDTSWPVYFQLPPQNNHGSPTLFLCFQQYLPCTTLALHKSIEVTPTCQWTVTFAWFAWNYLHKPLQKVTPTSSPIVNAAQTLTSNIYIATKLPKQNVNASHPDGKILFVFQR